MGLGSAGPRRHGLLGAHEPLSGEPTVRSPYSLVGPHAEQALRGLNADRLFLGVDGLDPEIGRITRTCSRPSSTQ